MLHTCSPNYYSEKTWEFKARPANIVRSCQKDFKNSSNTAYYFFLKKRIVGINVKLLMKLNVLFLLDLTFNFLQVHLIFKDFQTCGPFASDPLRKPWSSKNQPKLPGSVC